MVAAGPVHVSVRELLLGSGAHFGDLDLEVEGLAGKRMIAIEGHEVAAHLGYRDRAGPLLGLGLQAHADPHVVDALERTARNLLHELLVVFAVTFGWSDLHLQAVTRFAARQLALEPGDEIAVTMQVAEWLTFGGAVDDLARVVAERVVDTDDLILSDAHAESLVEERERAIAATETTADTHQAGAKDTIPARLSLAAMV